MTINEMRLVRLLARFFNAVGAADERWAEVADRDALFDGGEFSGPATRRAFNAECDAIAHRLGFANAGVAFDIARALPAGRRLNAVFNWPDVCYARNQR